ncbi:MAG TPA: hypothetical protein VH987_01405 [Candidatus Limnocylindria bacterium]|jgi:hypothetical protein
MTSGPPPDDQSTSPSPAPETPAAPAPPPQVTQPQYGQPQYAAPGYAMAPERPGMVTAAGIVMIVLGVLVTLFGLLFLIAGAFVGGAGNAIETQVPGLPANMAGAVAGVIIVFAIIFLAFGILDIVAGANVMGGKGWARITGIVLAVILGLLSLLGLGNPDQGGGIIITLLLIAANVFVIWALVTTGSWFASRALR